MPLTLRAGRPEEAVTIAQIWHESASLPGVGPAVIPAVDALRARVEAGFAQGWQVTLAFDDLASLGFMALLPKEAILAELFLRPSAGGTGLGVMLLDRAKVAMPDGFRLYTSATNGPARRFYEKAGLRLLSEGSHPRDGRSIIHYLWQP